MVLGEEVLAEKAGLLGVLERRASFKSMLHLNVLCCAEKGQSMLTIKGNQVEFSNDSEQTLSICDIYRAGNSRWNTGGIYRTRRTILWETTEYQGSEHNEGKRSQVKHNNLDGGRSTNIPKMIFFLLISPKISYFFFFPDNE